MHYRNLVLAVVFLCLLPQLLLAQGQDYIKEHYTKQEHRIAMRDGVKLFTVVYIPKDQSKKYPILLERTPYSAGPYGPDRYKGNLGPSAQFGREGYIVVYQDVRGRLMSEGKMIEMCPVRVEYKSPKDVDETTDTFDTVDWLVKNIPNNNGRVGQWGISWVGFFAGVGMVHAHPAMKASSPQAPQTDWWMGDDVHHNGAFFLQQEFAFDANFNWPRPGPRERDTGGFRINSNNAYEYFLKLGPLPRAQELYFKNKLPWWTEIMDHPNYDAFWQARNLLPHLKNITPAVLTVGGWYDAEDLYGAVNMFKKIEAQSPATKNYWVMGPWTHGAWAGRNGTGLGALRFGSDTSTYFREKIEFPFFQHYLKDQGDFNLPKVTVFETGKNEWHQGEIWPPKDAQPKSLYLGAGKKLSFDSPAESGTKAFDEFVSDPADPVPYTKNKTIQYPRTFMIEDQRFLADRKDVLTYVSAPLTKDVTIVGPVEPNLHVSTSGTDSDWVVKLIDVNPDDSAIPQLKGYQQLVRGDVMRGKFRKSWEKPEPFIANEPAAVNFIMPDIYHTFRKGHRIMVQVQSSWFPLVDRNPQTFTDINQAKESDFQKATQRVFRSKEMASQIKLLVVE